MSMIGTDSIEGRASTTAAPKAVRGSKVAFIMGLPHDLGAKEVIAQAKEQGIAITDSYVYMVRAAGKAGANASRKGKPGKPARRPAAKAATAGKAVKGGKAAKGPSFAGLRLAADDPREQALMEALRALGVARAREVIDVIEKFERVVQ